jgi:hypothetical protein
VSSRSVARCSASASTKLLLGAAIAVLTVAACTKVLPTFIYNTTDVAVRVEYSGVADGTACSLDAWGPPGIQRGAPDVRDGRRPSVSPPDYVFERATCTVRATVPPRSAMFIRIVSECLSSDRNPSGSPDFASIRLTGERGTVVRSGWEASKLFRPVGEMCVYRYG